MPLRAMSEDISHCHGGSYCHLVGGGPRLLLNILHRTGQPPQIIQSKMARVQLLTLFCSEKITGFQMETPGLNLGNPFTFLSPFPHL